MFPKPPLKLITMRDNYRLAQPLVTFIFLLSFILQSCSKPPNPTFPTKKRHISTNQQISTTEQKILNSGNPATNCLRPSCSDSSVVNTSITARHLPIIPEAKSANQFTFFQENPSSNLNSHFSPLIYQQAHLTKNGKFKQHTGVKQQPIKIKKREKIKFYQEAGLWKARILEKHGSLSTTHYLPVYIAADISPLQVAGLLKANRHELIHINLPRHKNPGCVYVSNWGLKGGGNLKGNSMPSLPGYTLLACLHEGATSNIYRAVRFADGYPVIIKVSPQKILAEKRAQRFRQEFSLGQQVHSPYVIRYLELKEDPAYGIALVMEDDEAVELASIIPPAGFSNREFIGIAIQIVQGLQSIHAKNIIHHDLKLNNILIRLSNKAIKIIDFNCASTLRQESPSTTSLMAGTLAYVSPEQTGRINRSVDYRTDFYSLGVIFYQLLCGELPFVSKDALGLIHQHLAKQPLFPHKHKSTIALPLSHLVMKLLEKEAENRYQSCEGILHDLLLCLSALDKMGTIAEFELGEHDSSSKLTLSQHLYGREKEIKTLVNAFERVSEGSKCEGVMVAGQPGVGKTMLIQEMRKPIALKQGYFITGKFDQLNKSVAYSALSQAFNSLIQQWLTEDEASINYWKTQLVTTLGKQAPLLIKVIPALTLLINEQVDVAITDINQAKNAFNWAFQEFVKVCASSSHPLVIFLDDLQWADQASLDLITYLLQHPNISYLLWIGAYRDTEVTSSFPTLQAITTLQEASIRIQTLTLAPLQLENLCRWIADSLHKSLTHIQPLAELIFQKTAGNPFFVKLFLQSLYDAHLLKFSSHNYWQWNINKIRQYPATENVITLMTYQIQQLPAVTEQALKIASCLGHRVMLNTLQTAMACSQDAVYEALEPALNSGILIQTDNEVYFAHDRVQEAAYHLIAEVEKGPTHLVIGQRLLASPLNKRLLLLDIVAQFNRCRSLVVELQERLCIALLNLEASQKAKQATAYAAALDYLYIIPEWIDIEILWKTDYSFAFTLHKELAEVEYLNGHTDISQAIIADMQPHLQSTLDKVKTYHLLIIQNIVQGQQQQAIVNGHKALRLLGSGLPIDNPLEFIQHEMPLLKQKLDNIPLPSLLNAPVVIDPEKQALFKILAALTSACYQVGSKLLPAITAMSINLSLTHGHISESCMGYAMYGLLLCTQYQEYALGYKYGNFAIQLAKKMQSPAQICQSSVIMFNFISAWSSSIQHLPSLLSSAGEAGLSCGEIEYAGYCKALKLHMLFDQGAHLANVQQELLAVLQFVKSTNIKNVMYYIMRCLQRMAVNLSGGTQNEEDFSYDHVSDEDFETECQQSTSGNMSLSFYHIRKAQVLYIHKRFEQALQHIGLARSKLVYLAGFYETAIFNWYDSLTHLALYPTASDTDQLAYLEQVKQNQQQMQEWRASCPENFAHKHVLVEAGLAQLKGDYEQAEAYYDEAIKLADQHGFIQEQALAAELAAKYWLSKGKSVCAQGYLNIAFNGYKQWGAKRKLMRFRAEYPDLLKALAPPGLSQLAVNQQTTLSVNTLKFLDLSSILKASQTISSEIELTKLLHGMMQIIIENAGAQQGAVLFLEAPDTIVVQAEYARDGAITTLQEIQLADWKNGAQTVIQYVKRIHQSVVLDQATTNEQFKMDPYIIRAQAKSILCVPLLKHTELKAILYVENNLMTHAFTPERVQTILILTAQMTISLENARYFSEQIELTRRLADQSARAQMAEESLHALAHDLKLALEASQSGTWNWWINTNKITWDVINCALFGLKPDEFKGTNDAFLELIHPEDRNQVNQEIKRCIEQDIPFDTEYRVIWPDKTVHVIAAQGRVYHDKSGRPIKMAGVCLDMTPRRQLEQERLDALQQAEKAQRQRAEEAERYRKQQEEFIDTVCHEIRNPMTGIYGNVDFLKQIITTLETCKETLADVNQSTLTDSIEKLKESTKTIEYCIKHQKSIIDDVLDLSKLQAGKMELLYRPFKLQDVIEEATRLFPSQLSTKSLELVLDLPKDAVAIKGDFDRLKLILINLLSNAVKFTEKGYVKISLQTQALDSKHVQLIIQIEDTGIGMSPKEQSHLFQQFSRPLSSQYEGSGLGLAISKKLLDLMGGNIQVHSVKGQGSTFTIYLTCETVQIEKKASPLIPCKQPSPLSIFSSETKYILVVEDNHTNQKILCRHLELGGYKCAIAINGQKALEALGALGEIEAPEKWNKAGFALILMDLEMPVMGGLEATQLIRQKEEQLGIAPIPIVGVSAYAREIYREEAKQAGMNDYLTKPYIKEELYKVIQYLLSAPNLTSK
jgi:PAS domain S-box-containing protein